MQWFKPATQETRWEDCLSSGIQDQPGQHSENLSLQKIKKLVRSGGTHLWSQLLGRLRQENHLNPGGGGCGELRLHHRTLVGATRVREWEGEE